MATLEEQVARRMGARVAAVREELGLSKADVAEILRISPQAYTPYESGKRSYSVAQVFTLARAFGKAPEWLLGIETDLSPDESEVVWLYRLIEPKTHALQYLRMLAGAPPAPSGTGQS
jgi:transcriptional regulator with XRE-family HTH domain